MNSATAAMLDGIKEACEAWGRAMRIILSSVGVGYPTMATMERARQGSLEPTAPVLKQKFSEVLLGDALAVSTAIRQEPLMPEEQQRVLWMHFVVPHRKQDGTKYTVTEKSEELGYKNRRDYYSELDKASHFLLARVPVGYANTVETVRAQSKTSGNCSTSQF